MQVSVSADLDGQILIMSYCIEGAMAIEMLAVIYSQTRDSDIAYSMLTCLPDTQKATLKLGPTSSNQYTVSVFAVNQEGLPFNRTAMKPQTIMIRGVATTGRFNHNLYCFCYIIVMSKHTLL